MISGQTTLVELELELIRLGVTTVLVSRKVLTTSYGRTSSEGVEVILVSSDGAAAFTGNDFLDSVIGALKAREEQIAKACAKQPGATS